MFDKLILVLLGVWAIVYGIIHVTNIRVVWMEPIAGLCALVLGLVCLIRAFR